MYTNTEKFYNNVAKTSSKSEAGWREWFVALLKFNK